MGVRLQIIRTEMRRIISKAPIENNYDKAEYQENLMKSWIRKNFRAAQEFKYLLSIIQRDGSSDLFIERRIRGTKSSLSSRIIKKKIKLFI